jgi:hypothetical protein
MAARVESGIDPSEVAAKVVDVIREDQLNVITHPGMRAGVEKRFATILAAMDKLVAG